MSNAHWDGIEVIQSEPLIDHIAHQGIMSLNIIFNILDVLGIRVIVKYTAKNVKNFQKLLLIV